MSNVFAGLPLPTLNGAGAGVDVSTMGAPKTIEVVGSFVGATIIVEASEDGGVTYGPVVVFQNVGGARVIDVVAQFMRVTVSGRKTTVPFSANCDVGAPMVTPMFAAISLPSGNGAGAATDVSLFGEIFTVVVGGTFSGAVVLIEISEDGTDYAPLKAFAGQGGLWSGIVTANWVRANVSGRKGPVPFTATAAFGAVQGGGGGVVIHDDTLHGDGTLLDPLGVVAPNQVDLTNGEAVSVPPGTPAYISAAATFMKAKADVAATGRVIGLTIAAIGAGSSGVVQTGGVLELTTAEWDAIAGTVGGLSFNVPYYLDAATAGKLTATPPSTTGQVVQQVIVGISPTQAKVDITVPEVLGSGNNIIRLTNNSGGPMIIGTPVYSSAADAMGNGIANNTAKSQVIGLVADTSVANGALGNVAVGGVLIATTAQWDAVAGTVGGLTFNTIYYLSPTVAGRLTSVAPTTLGQEVVQVITALSTTEARIAIQPPIFLST